MFKYLEYTKLFMDSMKSLSKYWHFLQMLENNPKTAGTRKDPAKPKYSWQKRNKSGSVILLV
jgi:hypothetical protein